MRAKRTCGQERGFDEGEVAAQVGPDRRSTEPTPRQTTGELNSKHSRSVEAQVKALQEEATAENDYIDRAMLALGMR